MIKFKNNKQKFHLGLGLFFIILSVAAFIMHDSVINLMMGFVLLLSGIGMFTVLAKELKGDND